MRSSHPPRRQRVLPPRTVSRLLCKPARSRECRIVRSPDHPRTVHSLVSQASRGTSSPAVPRDQSRAMPIWQVPEAEVLSPDLRDAEPVHHEHGTDPRAPPTQWIVRGSALDNGSHFY